jgi:hypothetical protein
VYCLSSRDGSGCTTVAVGFEVITLPTGFSLSTICASSVPTVYRGGEQEGRGRGLQRFM